MLTAGMEGYRGFSAFRTVAGLIGYDVIHRFDVTFDYRADRMFLRFSNYGKRTRF